MNEFRVNFTRFNFNQIATSQNVDFGIPRIEIEGYNFDRIRFGPPQGATTPAAFTENSFDFRDTITKNVNTHALRLGIDIIDEQNNNNLSGAARPLYSNSLLWNFANDTPVFESIDANPQTGGPANAQRYLRSKDYELAYRFPMDAGDRHSIQYLLPTQAPSTRRVRQGSLIQRCTTPLTALS